MVRKFFFPRYEKYVFDVIINHAVFMKRELFVIISTNIAFLPIPRM